MCNVKHKFARCKKLSSSKQRKMTRCAKRNKKNAKNRQTTLANSGDRLEITNRDKQRIMRIIGRS